MIEEKTVFVTRGKQFDTIEAAELYRQDLIGELMNKALVRLHPRDRIALVDFIAENRAALRSLLDY